MSETVVPDAKDWTWVLDRPCPDCGFDASTVAVDRIAGQLRDNAASWQVVLTLPDAGARPQPTTWSPLEYACHVRDVHRVFGRRVGLMLAEDDPVFDNWDQDETARAERYAEQHPATVAADLLAAAEGAAARYESVPPGAWERPGHRSNGSGFTVGSIGLYHLHDVVHHAWDVRAAVVRATIAAYDASADDYRDGLAARIQQAGDPTDEQRDGFIAALRPGARVLEIGSGAGFDADDLEAAGLDVRRTDISPGFVDLLRAAGHDADVLDPLTDDLDDPRRPGTPYDGVWANACLLHVDRVDLPTVLRRLAEATRVGGVLALALKEGDGERWSTHGSVSGPRRFVFWRADALTEVVERSGWRVDHVGSSQSGLTGEPWVDVRAVRR